MSDTKKTVIEFMKETMPFTYAEQKNFQLMTTLANFHDWIKKPKRPKKSFYHIYKKLSNGKLEAMGGYEGSDPQDAINKMAKSGNLKGNEFVCPYMAIPYGPHLKALMPKL